MPSDTDDEVQSPETYERSKRAVLRTINTTKKDVLELLSGNPSSDVVHQAKALLEEWKQGLSRLVRIDHSLLAFIDTSKLKSPAEIEKAEYAVTKEFEVSNREFGKAKGNVYAMVARLEREATATHKLASETLNASIPTTENNSLTKLPNIKVPKFDGKIHNFTEWRTLFDAMIHNNDDVKPVNKLYYLKGAMVEEAATLLKDFALSEGMYDHAYQYVVDRYYNKRAIIADHFRNLVELPDIQLSKLRESLDKLHATVRGIEACGLDTKKMSPLIAYIIVRKLPEKLRTDWENSNLDYSTYPSFGPLATFLSNRCFAHETTTSPTESSRKSTINPKAVLNSSKATSADRGKNKTSLTTVSSTFKSCVDCGENHYLSQCPSFQSKSIADRYSLVSSKELCRNCLRTGHISKVCRSSSCQKCRAKHHTMLHRDTLPLPISNAAQVESQGTSTEKLSAIATQPISSDVILLPSAVVKVRVGSRCVLARALIDSCSQVNLVSESFVRKNRIEKCPSVTNIVGVTSSGIKSGFAVKLIVESRYNEYQITFNADVIGKIPYEIEKRVIYEISSLDPNLQFADNSLQSTEVDILIGAEYYNRVMLGNKKFFGELCLEESKFGWLASGPLNRSKPLDPLCCCLAVTAEEILTKFWEIEEVSPSKILLPEHELCDAHFMENYVRLPDGRFQVRLPFKSPTKHANTYQQARSALIKYETQSSELQRSMYVSFMKEYRELRHMKLVNTEVDAVSRYYIPHLPVWRPDSSTTQLRVVFNASARNKSGPSLNETLMNGPTLQPDLFDILVKFRLYPVAFSADISKMYRQVAIHPCDQPYQSILWRDDVIDEIQTYELTTLTYGTTPAAYIATKCLQIVAEENRSYLPAVADAIASEFYMDDLLSGADNVDSAIEKAKQIHNSLLRAKFPLRKYVSNSSNFLKALDTTLVEELRPVQFSSSGAAKILGLQWCPFEDEFRINVHPVDITHVELTKRVISSLTASIYDPLGLVTPYTIQGKILLQDLWRENLGWDDPIQEELAERFREYYIDLKNLPNFKIYRPYSTQNRINFDLIGFSDASSRAYGAVVYLKSYNDTSTEVSIICSKSKVAPLKAYKVPRLELLGTQLLAKLMLRVAKRLNYDLSNAYAFCDSTIVLAWLKGPASKYEVFVRNRVDYVTSIIPFERWSYVRTKENPADLTTRGITVKSLTENLLWLNGPSWLKEEIHPSINVALPPDPPEIRKSHTVLIAYVGLDESIIDRFSSFLRLIRAISNALKIITRFRTHDESYQQHNENEARNAIYRMSQNVWFQEEINALRKNSPLPSRSPLIKLSPFIDEYGVLRVGGRLGNSALSYNTKHPVIVHKKSSLAVLLARHAHEEFYHASQSFMIGFLQSRWHIVNGVISLARTTLKKCVWCARMRAEPIMQIMGDLPSDRTTIARPFTFASVDFAGPFTIRCTNHRSPKHLKHYAALFVCMVTRAVHIESVADLTTDAFASSFQRFIGRRGIPNTMWSDNGNNFVGMKNEIERNRVSFDIKWKFIPPRSPHHGGIWESAVKAAKKHLIAVTHGAVLNEDQFKTVLISIEAILNSRPLYARRNMVDVDVVDVLTPGHFLVGSSLLEQSNPDFLNCSLFERLTLQRQIISSFWTHWRKSYLAMLQTRNKWKAASPNLKIGDIVLLRESSSPSCWPLGRIIDGTPDRKNHLRIVTVRSKGSEFKRSVQQLVKLPIEEESYQDPKGLRGGSC